MIVITNANQESTTSAIQNKISIDQFISTKRLEINDTFQPFKENQNDENLLESIFDDLLESVIKQVESNSEKNCVNNNSNVKDIALINTNVKKRKFSFNGKFQKDISEETSNDSNETNDIKNKRCRRTLRSNTMISLCKVCEFNSSNIDSNICHLCEEFYNNFLNKSKLLVCKMDDNCIKHVEKMMSCRKCHLAKVLKFKQQNKCLSCQSIYRLKFVKSKQNICYSCFSRYNRLKKSKNQFECVEKNQNCDDLSKIIECHYCFIQQFEKLNNNSMNTVK